MDYHMANHGFIPAWAVVGTMGDKPPSRKRYEEENPTVSFRISKAHKETLDDMMAGLETTKKDWFETIIDEEQPDYSTAFERGRAEGYDEGYRDGRSEAAPDVPCWACGNPVTLESEEEQDRLYDGLKEMQKFTGIPPPSSLKDLIGFTHDDCPADLV